MTRDSTRRRLLVAALLSGLLATTGCGGGGGASEADTTQPPEDAVETPDATGGEVTPEDVEEDTSDALTCTTDEDCEEAPGALDACRAATCSEDGVCVVAVASGAACDDGDACTTGDACDAEGVCSGEALDCSDLDGACVAGSCDPATGECVAEELEDGAPCDDGDACTTGDACAGGVCGGEARDCSDLDGACAEGACDPSSGECVAEPLEDGTTCDDGDACTTGDACADGACGGEALDCSAEDGPCTVGVCDPTGGGCLAEPVDDGTLCDDGDACSSGETCQAGVCLPAEVLDCDDGDACNGVESCDPETGFCALGEAVVCGDGDPCNGVEACDPDTGACLEGEALVCDDGDACDGEESCDPEAGCVEGQPLDCDDDEPCTDDACDPAEGCVHTLAEGCECLTDADCAPLQTEGTCDGTLVCAGGACVVEEGSVVPCDASGDGPCEETACDAETGLCETTPQTGGACDDGDACTTGDACEAGTCQGAAVDCSALDGACVQGVCDGDGGCTTAPANEGGGCDDEDACTGSDRCEGGACVGDPLTCDDGDVCDGEETCAPDTGCVPGQPLDCDDGDPCTIDACDPLDGCSSTPDPGCECIEDADCAPYQTAGTCDGTLVCVDHACVVDPATVTACDTSGDGPCEVTTCDTGSGLCETAPVADQTPCDDGDACTTGDACTAGTCGGAPKDCSALDDVCAVGQCAEDGTCVAAPAHAGGACDDGDPCTEGDVCGGGTCAGAAVSCGHLDSTCAVGACDAEAGGCVAVATSEGEPCDAGDPCLAAGVCTSGACEAAPLDCSHLDDACVVGVCDGAGGCTTEPREDGTSCDDGDPCTAGDTCTGGTCGGAAKDCSDLDGACTVGACDATTGACEALPAHQGDPCQTGSLCDLEGVCDGGVCAAPAVDCGHLDSTCTAGLCDEVTGDCKAVAAHEAGTCDDGKSCTVDDACAGGVCTGDGLDCSHLDEECVIGVCDGQGGCTTEPRSDGLGCDDGNACTESDACFSGFCVGSVRSCPSDDPCQTGACDPATGQCTYGPGNEGMPCEDGDACTTGDYCDGGVCAGVEETCAGLEPGPCQVAACDPASGGCVLEPAAPGTGCDDGNPCTFDDACGAEGCAGTPLDCSALDDPAACVVGTCSPETGACTTSGAPDGTICDDGDPCTVDDQCTLFACGGTTKDCSGADGPCTVGVCHGGTGACEAQPLQDGTECGPGDACTLERCDGGTCAAVPVDCSHLDGGCVLGACDPAAGGCVSTAREDAWPCDDGDACTAGDQCTGGACGGDAITCEGVAGACETAQCDPATGGCVVDPVQDGTGCEDGDLCTTGDACAGGQCVSGGPVDCSGAGNACNDMTCDPQTGDCAVPVPVQDGTDCDDGLVCNGVATCQSGACTGGAPPDCSSLDGPCTDGICDEFSGGCVEALLDGDTCDTGDPCTTGICDQGSCSATPIPECVPPGPVLCELSGSAGDVVSCDVRVVRACQAVPPTGTVQWRLAWDATQAVLLTHTDRLQDPATWPPAYGYPGFDGLPSPPGYVPTAEEGPFGTTYLHQYAVGPGDDYTQWSGEMTLALYYSGSTLPIEPLADGYLDASGAVVGEDLLMRVHFELLADVSASAPTAVEAIDLVAADPDVSSFAPYLDDQGRVVLDYDPPTCE